MMQTLTQQYTLEAYRSLEEAAVERHEYPDYVLVNQYQPLVDQYVRTDQNEWLMRTHEGLEAIVSLETIDTTLSAADIYEDVVFASSTAS